MSLRATSIYFLEVGDTGFPGNKSITLGRLLRNSFFNNNPSLYSETKMKPSRPAETTS